MRQQRRGRKRKYNVELRLHIVTDIDRIRKERGKTIGHAARIAKRLYSERQKLQDTLGYAPRGLRAERAAAYVGMSKTKFLELVDDGRMPKPLCIDGVRVWDRIDLDAAFEDIKRAPDRINTIDMILGLDKQ